MLDLDFVETLPNNDIAMIGILYFILHISFPKIYEKVIDHFIFALVETYLQWTDSMGASYYSKLLWVHWKMGEMEDLTLQATRYVGSIPSMDIWEFFQPRWSWGHKDIKYASPHQELDCRRATIRCQVRRTRLLLKPYCKVSVSVMYLVMIC